MVAGEIVAGPHVRNACRRHLRDLETGPGRGLTWDVAAANRAIGFFEDVLKLSEGQFEGEPFKLDPSQCFIVGSLFGWKRPDGTRRFRRAYIEQGKGNGKSPLVGGIGLYGLVADGEAGAQIYSAGAVKEQAGILFADAVKMVKKAPHLLSRLTFSGGEGREFNIAHPSTGSFFRPVSREARRTGSGPRPHFALCDEVHEHPDRGVIEILERGFKFRRQPLLVMITNSGSDRKSVCWEEHERAIRVAAGTRTPGRDFAFVGEPIGDETFSYVCALDPGDDPLNDPSCWVKANPLLGTILKPDYLAGVVAEAKAMPGKLNGILRLHFCVWTESAQAWISGEALHAVLADFDPIEHAGSDLFAGTDLAGTKDLTAAAFMVQTGYKDMPAPDGTVKAMPTYDAWVEAWTPEEGLAERSHADQTPYDLWVQEGHLNATPGKIIRYEFVAQRFAEIDQDFDIQLLAYDNYAWAKFEEALTEFGVMWPSISHPQAGRKKAKPPEEWVEAARKAGRPAPDGLWMPGSLNALEQLILEGRIRIRSSPVVIAACMGAMVESDVLENRWFAKRKATQRIDPVVALAMCAGAATASPSATAPPSVYETRGLRSI